MAKKPVKYFLVDAFTESPFKGNPVAVCFLEEEEEERNDQWLQGVAVEFNISQICFLTLIAESDRSVNSLNGTSNPRFHLRWFTPITEVKLCGHATLAAANTLFSSGLDPITEFNLDESSLVSGALDGASIIDIRRSQVADDIFVVVTSGENVTQVQPQLDAIVKCPGRGIIVSGIAPPGSGFDFYSRFFCPKFGINEDPACGTAHCALASYWSKKLGKCDLNAYQASPRGGVFNIHLDEQNQRVLLRGKVVIVMEGSVLV